MKGVTFQDFSVHGTGFSQWLVTNFMSAEFIRRKFWRAHLLMRREFFGSAGALPSRKVIHQSPIASRYSLPFSARQEPRHPIFPVPRPTPRFKGRLQIGELVLYKLHGNAAVAELADALA